MGVRGLFRFVQEIRKQAKLKEVEGLRVGLDAFCLLYLFKTNQEAFATYLDSLLTLHYKLTMVMDKKAQKEKATVVEQRKEVRAEHRADAQGLEEFISSTAFAELDEAAQDVLQTSLLHKQKGAWQLTPDHTKWFVSILESKGIPLVYAKEEADIELARGEFDCVVSSDSDMIVLGCPCLLVPKLTKHGVEHDMYRYADVKKAIGFDGEQLYELAFLAGCDVQPTPITDIETAASWLRFYGSLAAVATKKKGIITDEHMKLYAHLREHVWG